MASARSTVRMTTTELKAWPTLGSLPTCADEEQAHTRLTVDSLPSFGSSDKEDSDDQGEGGRVKKASSLTSSASTNSVASSGASGASGASTPPWRRGSVRSGSSGSSSPASPATVRAAPGLEDLVAPEQFDGAVRYDRSLLLQVRLRLCEVGQGEEEPHGICCQGRQQPRGGAPEVEVAAPEAREAREAGGAAGRTTVMLRNLPNQCTRAMLAKFLAATEFDGQFDLVYVPMDRTSGNNLGYSFINFVEASSCQRFIRAMNGTKAAKCFPGSRSGKVLACNYAKVQGKEPYCQGLANAATKMFNNGDELAAFETMAPVPGMDLSGLAAEEQSEECPSKFEGLRMDAPEFVPGRVGTDAPTASLGDDAWFRNARVQAGAREEAVASALRYSSKLFVPGQSGALFVPPRADKEHLAETN